MGAAHSNEPRSVSMDNPTAIGVIDVSDEVVERLKKGLSKQKAKENVAPPSASTPAPSKKEVRVVPTKVAVPPSAPAQTVIYQNHAPPAHAHTNIGPLSAMEVLRQKEVELDQNDTIWRKRMEQLEQTLRQTDSIMEKEFSDASNNVRQRFSTGSLTHQLPPCQDLKSQLMACYNSYPGETLRCADYVKNFNSCVNMNYIERAVSKEQSPAIASASASTSASGSSSATAKAA